MLNGSVPKDTSSIKVISDFQTLHFLGGKAFKSKTHLSVYRVHDIPKIMRNKGTFFVFENTIDFLKPSNITHVILECQYFNKCPFQCKACSFPLSSICVVSFFEFYYTCML